MSVGELRLLATSRFFFDIFNKSKVFFRGQSPAEAEFNFLDHAKRLDMYGVDLYPARVGV